MNETFGVGSVMNQGFKVWGRNLVPFVLITAVIYVPMILWYVSFSSGLHGIGSRQEAKELLYFLGGTVALSVVLDCFVTATITYGVVKELQGQRASIGACVATGFKRMLPTLGVAIVTGIAILGGFILLIVPGIIVACMLYVATPASVIEKPGIMGALSRSRELTAGHKGQVFGIRFILWLIGWGVGKIQEAAIPPHDLASIQTSLYVSLGVQVVLGSLASVMAAVAYAQLRAEKDGTGANELAAVFE